MTNLIIARLFADRKTGILLLIFDKTEIAILIILESNKILFRFIDDERLDLSYNEKIKNYCVRSFTNLVYLNLNENSLITFKGISQVQFFFKL